MNAKRQMVSYSLSPAVPPMTLPNSSRTSSSTSSCFHQWYCWLMTPAFVILSAADLCSHLWRHTPPSLPQTKDLTSWNHTTYLVLHHGLHHCYQRWRRLTMEVYWQWLLTKNLKNGAANSTFGYVLHCTSQFRPEELEVHVDWPFSLSSINHTLVNRLL